MLVLYDQFLHSTQSYMCIVLLHQCVYATSMGFEHIITFLRLSVYFQVWNFQNGHNLHKLEPADDSEVTGVLSLTDKEFMLSVGWSRNITKYDDSEGDVSSVSTNDCIYN